MPLWVSDFLGDTMDLDASEVGSYLLLLMAQWNRNGESLPEDKLKRMARGGRNWPDVWATLSRFFDRDEAGIFSRRLRFEAQNVAAKRLVNSQSGALGGKAKALKNNDPALANATETLQRNPSIPEPYPEREKREAIASPKKPRAARLPADWILPPEWDDWAFSQGMASDQIKREADQFRDYWHGTGKPMVDWLATWRRWCRTSMERNYKAKGKSNGNDFDAKLKIAAERLSAGAPIIDHSRRDPFAARPGADPDAPSGTTRALL